MRASSRRTPGVNCAAPPAPRFFSNAAFTDAVSVSHSRRDLDGPLVLVVETTSTSGPNRKCSVSTALHNRATNYRLHFDGGVREESATAGPISPNAGWQDQRLTAAPKDRGRALGYLLALPQLHPRLAPWAASAASALAHTLHPQPAGRFVPRRQIGNAGCSVPREHVTKPVGTCQ